MVGSNHVLSRDQIFIKSPILATNSSKDPKKLRMKDSELELRVFNKDLELIFDKSSGDLKKYQVNGLDLIKSSPHLNFGEHLLTMIMEMVCLKDLPHGKLHLIRGFC